MGARELVGEPGVPLFERVWARPTLEVHGIRTVDGPCAAVAAQPDDPAPLRVVGCGRVLPDHDMRVVDAAGLELPEIVLLIRMLTRWFQLMNLAEDLDRVRRIRKLDEAPGRSPAPRTARACRRDSSGSSPKRSTSRRSPGRSETRWNPFSSCTGGETLLTTSVTYSCTTSSPARRNRPCSGRAAILIWCLKWPRPTPWA